MSTDTIVTHEKVVYVNSSQFKMVKWVQQAASKDPARPSLLPVYVVADAQQVEFFASDGFRIHWATLPANPISAWETGMYLMSFGTGMVLLDPPPTTESVLHLMREIIQGAQTSRGLDTEGAQRVAALVDFQPRYVRDAMACPATASRIWLRGGPVEIEFFDQDLNHFPTTQLVARAIVMPFFTDQTYQGHKLSNGHGCIPVLPPQPKPAGGEPE